MLCRQQNSQLVVRGRKLVLNYTHGSPCDIGREKRFLKGYDIPSLQVKSEDNMDKDEADRRKKLSKGDALRHKSSIISFLCEKEPMSPKGSKASVAFVGVSYDECTYFFEVRSHAACAGIETAQQQLGPGGVFGVM